LRSFGRFRRDPIEIVDYWVIDHVQLLAAGVAVALFLCALLPCATVRSRLIFAIIATQITAKFT
jgi:hypothetical protein